MLVQDLPVHPLCPPSQFERGSPWGPQISDSYPLSSQPPAPPRTCRSFSPALFDLEVHIHPETHRWTWERVSEHAPIWHSTATTRARDATRLPLWDVGRLISPLRQCARDETTNAVIRVASYLGASVWRWCPSAPTMWSARHRRMEH